MKHRKHPFRLVLILAVLTALGAGCGKPENAPSASNAAPAKTEKPPETAKTKEAEQETAEAGKPVTGREITDMAGRTVILPDSVETIFPTDPTAGIYLYTLVPDKMLGWNYALNDIEKTIIPEAYHNLPNFGMGDAINYEAVIAAGPSVVLVVDAIHEGTIDAADQLYESLGIPVVMVDNSLEATPNAYRLMGEWFGAPEESEKLAAYAERTFMEVDAMDIPEEQRVRMYYGNGEDAMETPPAGSTRAQFIDRSGAINVAELELGDGAMAQISLEQLLAWDPDVIVVNGEPKSSISGRQTADRILNDPDFSSLKAVQNGQVYGTPNAPFSWVDRPPGPNRLIGIRWLSGLMYPDALGFDVDEEVCEFFRLFYHVELTEEQLASLYDGTIGQGN
ncbi:MAG: ABC transporter substrate-binding protein [Lachnospiraceae bacterium]|jgi:iron complex transport system substrate-binding protein|nr:ABC transporter substrate-binding protein [Lachnospiraceae bacterium]